MANSENSIRNYTQFDNHSIPNPNYQFPSPVGPTTTVPTSVSTTANGTSVIHNEKETMWKKWKNSKRLCWALLILSILTVILEIAGSGIAGIHMDVWLAQFIAGIWLALIGVVASVLGIFAFKNPYQSSKCLSLSHFILLIISTVAYGILFLLAIVDIIAISRAISDIFYPSDDYADYELEKEESRNSSAMPTTAATAPAGPEPRFPLLQNSTQITTTATTTEFEIDSLMNSLLHALRGQLAICVFLLGITIAFFAISIVALVLICRKWSRGKNKTMTIVYSNQTGENQTQTVTVPAKTQVVVIPAARLQ